MCISTIRCTARLVLLASYLRGSDGDVLTCLQVQLSLLGLKKMWPINVLPNILVCKARRVFPPCVSRRWTLKPSNFRAPSTVSKNSHLQVQQLGEYECSDRLRKCERLRRLSTPPLLLTSVLSLGRSLGRDADMNVVLDGSRRARLPLSTPLLEHHRTPPQGCTRMDDSRFAAYDARIHQLEMTIAWLTQNTEEANDVPNDDDDKNGLNGLKDY